MNPKDTQNVEIAIQKKITAMFTDQAVFREIGERLAAKIKKMILERIFAGYDLMSRKFGNYNVSYDKKRAFKYASRRYGTTEYASSSTKDKLRLTGRLLSSLDVRMLGIESNLRQVKFKFLVYLKDPTQIPKAIGLQSTTGVARNHQVYSKKAYTFLGLAVSGAWKNREDEEIKQFLFREVGDIINRKVGVKRA